MQKKICTYTRMFLLIAAVATSLLVTSPSAAFDTITRGECELTVYGFLRNNLGWFLEDHDYAQDGDDLATARTWLRGYLDFRASENLRFWAAVQFVNEPWYEIETGSVSKRSGKEYSEYNDIDDVLREAYIDWSPSKNHSFRIGRQIVIWGEALTERVGDVIHPEDQRFTFAFANLEDTRIPLWMVKATHSFSSINTSFEWLVSPNLVEEQYRVNRTGAFAVPIAGQAGQRFAIHPEDRFLPPFSVTNPALGPPFSFPGVVLGPPFSRGWFNLFPGPLPDFWLPTESPHIFEDFPENSANNLRFGFRTSTFMWDTEFGISYYHTQEYNPTVKRGSMTGATDPMTGAPIRNYLLIHPNVDIMGVYANKDLPLGLMRAEAIYIPNKPFNTFDRTDQDAVVTRDYIKYMVAWDLAGYFYFDWHKTAPFDITIEHTGEIVPDNDDLQFVIYATDMETWKPRLSTRISTNWFYNLLSTELIASYGFEGQDGLLMPVVKYMPSWRDHAFSVEVRYVNIFGDNSYEDLGILKEKDLIVITTQFNF